MKSHTSAVENCLSDSNTHQINCDVCKGKETVAVGFCVDCEKKLCEEHDKVLCLNFRDKTRHLCIYWCALARLFTTEVLVYLLAPHTTNVKSILLVCNGTEFLALWVKIRKSSIPKRTIITDLMLTCMQLANCPLMEKLRKLAYYWNIWLNPLVVLLK